jgi:hypothetical protein
MAMSPAPSASTIRLGLTSTIRALEWRVSVMMPLWEPVKDLAGWPISLSAIDNNVIEIRSPTESSMSSSRAVGVATTSLASDRSLSVVSPMALTTTTTRFPRSFSAIMRRATRVSFSGSATDEPPYLWTTMGRSLIPYAPSSGG